MLIKNFGDVLVSKAWKTSILVLVKWWFSITAVWNVEPVWFILMMNHILRELLWASISAALPKFKWSSNTADTLLMIIFHKDPTQCLSSSQWPRGQATAHCSLVVFKLVLLHGFAYFTNRSFKWKFLLFNPNFGLEVWNGLKSWGARFSSSETKIRVKSYFRVELLYMLLLRPLGLYTWERFPFQTYCWGATVKKHLEQ